MSTIEFAGIPFRSRVHEIEPADWDRVLAVNLTGPLLGIQTVPPLMGAGGSIVNVGSVAGLTGYHSVVRERRRDRRRRRADGARRREVALRRRSSNDARKGAHC